MAYFWLNFPRLTSLASGPQSSVQPDGAEKSVEMPRFLYVCKSCLPDEVRQQPGKVVFRRWAIKPDDALRSQSHQPVLRRTPVGNVNFSARPEHPPDLGERPQLVLPRQVVKEKTRQHAVK